ncbi:ABC transporter permease subunit [Pseudohalocynthiibacter aestuariivivens]|nr:ABC transporter permease subunit [Pseudohalocynthiibacter aestuariivivens]QIE44211.1 ABC transporter permease subunit [Pseudohalocynthiibacter aestuariivivens]
MFTLRWQLLFIASPLIVIVVLFLGPLALTVTESFRTYIPGDIGSTQGAPFTLDNYRDLSDSAYVGYFADTFRLSFIAALTSMVLGYPLSHFIARRPPGFIRKAIVSALVILMFMSALVKVYALTIAFGPVGFGRSFSAMLGTRMNGSLMSEILVVIGLFSFLFPMTTLMMVSTIQNVNPRFLEAAVALGASWVTGHFRVILPLCIKGFVSTFIVIYTLAISAFVIPMILGRGQINFITNLIYTRFSEIANYPSGSALSVLMLLVSMVLVFISSSLLGRLAGSQKKQGTR